MSKNLNWNRFQIEIPKSGDRAQEWLAGQTRLSHENGDAKRFDFDLDLGHCRV